MKIPIDLDLKVDSKSIDALNNVFNTFMNDLRKSISDMKTGATAGTGATKSMENTLNDINSSTVQIPTKLSEISDNQTDLYILQNDILGALRGGLTVAGAGVGAGSTVDFTPVITKLSEIIDNQVEMYIVQNDMLNALRTGGGAGGGVSPLWFGAGAGAGVGSSVDFTPLIDKLNEIIKDIETPDIDINDILDMKAGIIDQYERIADRVKELNPKLYKDMQNDLDNLYATTIDPSTDLEKMQKELAGFKDSLINKYRKEARKATKKAESSVSKHYSELEKWMDDTVGKFLSLPIVSDIAKPFESINNIFKKMQVDLGGIAKSPFRFMSGFGGGFSEAMGNRPKGSGAMESLKSFKKAIAGGFTEGAKAAGLLGIGTKVFLVSILGLGIYTAWKMYIQDWFNTNIADPLGDVVSAIVGEKPKEPDLKTVQDYIDKARTSDVTPNQQMGYATEALKQMFPYDRETSAKDAMLYLRKNFSHFNEEMMGDALKDWQEQIDKQIRPPDNTKLLQGDKGGWLKSVGISWGKTWLESVETLAEDIDPFNTLERNKDFIQSMQMRSLPKHQKSKEIMVGDDTVAIATGEEDIPVEYIERQYPQKQSKEEDLKKLLEKNTKVMTENTRKQSRQIELAEQQLEESQGQTQELKKGNEKSKETSKVQSKNNNEPQEGYFGLSSNSNPRNNGSIFPNIDNALNTNS